MFRFLRRAFWDRERARELQTYLDQETDDNIARGMPPIEAARAARRKLGNVTRIREDIYEMNTVALIESAWRDLRHGARLLRRDPTFAVVAIFTLALGTGANAAIFQLVDAVRLRTLPVRNPHELVEIQVDNREHHTGNFTGRRPMLTYAQWQRLQTDQQTFSNIMAWGYDRFDLAAGGEVQPAEGLLVSGSFFETLGVPAAHGRLIGPTDDTPRCSAPGVVLSHGFWQRAYHGDLRVLDQTILLEGHRFDIIGVSAQGFFGVDVGRSFDVALPICAEPVFQDTQSKLDRRDAWFLASFGRLRPGATVESATTSLRAISAAIFRDTLPPRYVPEDAKWYLSFAFTAIEAGNGVSSLRQAYSTPLWILFGVTGLVLLITCANLANLLLARATAREREVSVRLALGAQRRRIVRQMLSESLLLAVIGAGAGLLVARWLTAFLVTFLSTGQQQLFVALAFDWRVFAFTAAVACAACVLFGLAPALRATASAPSAGLLGTRGASEGRERFTLRRTLVVVQVALSFVLVVGALLFGRSLRNLVTLDPGFRTDGIIIVDLDLRRAKVPLEQRRAVFDSIVARLQMVPGVDRAAEVFIVPTSGGSWNNRIVIDGTVQEGYVNFNAVGADYFRTLETRLASGREFTPQDGPGMPRVAVVNELFASRYFPGQSPLGRIFHLQDVPGSEPEARHRIVGVVADTKYLSLRENLTPIAYIAAKQEPVDDPYLRLALHSSIGATGVTPAIARAVREINPAIAVRFQSLEGIVRTTLTSERLMAVLAGFFGALAVLIAAIGLYGVMSYIVARRRMEIGIRMALGADRTAVVRMIVGDAGWLLAVGIVAGAVLATLGARSARSLLYGLEPWDLPTLGLAAAALGIVALLASWWPARRASLTAPTTALREE